MAAATIDDAATIAFRRAAPFVVLNVAPGLAASYVSRARLLSPACSFPDSCRKCGTYLFDGSADTRVVRPRKRRNNDKRQRVLRHFCLVCGNTFTVKSHRGDGPSTSQSQHRQITDHPPPQSSSNSRSERSVSLSSPALSSPHPPNVQSTSPEPQRQRQGGMHRTGLQVLLARNKRRKEQKPNADETTSGLAAFLKDL
ncbi:hypothetical protein AX15_007692 [Amanita polypyramis BW_CC]|nr:hypothetical protein AX15_007692 [Amanita polypyramis BW_CC]